MKYAPSPPTPPPKKRHAGDDNNLRLYKYVCIRVTSSAKDVVDASRVRENTTRSFITRDKNSTSWPDNTRVIQYKLKKITYFENQITEQNKTFGTSE